jgi:hypothetical protein
MGAQELERAEARSATDEAQEAAERLRGRSWWRRVLVGEWSRSCLSLIIWNYGLLIDMSDKALRMLKHMRKQILRHPAPYVVVRGAAISIGVDPGGSECDGLVDELLRDGHLQRYPSPSLTAHGLYRLTALGISAADEADSPGPIG